MRYAARLIVVLSAASFSFAAHAQGRVDSKSLTCNEAKALVKSRGELQMKTGPNSFERVVKSQRFCYQSERKKALYAPTSDKKRCKVGFVCKVGDGRIR